MVEHDIRTPDVEIPLEVEYRVPNEYGGHYIKRLRWCTYGEVFTACHKWMNVRECTCGHVFPDSRQAWGKPCPKCKERDCHAPYIDEYDSGPGSRPQMRDVEIGRPDEWLSEIVCYPQVGGNEGYHANLGVTLRNQAGEMRFVLLYWIKSFVGMKHALKLSTRLMVGTGAWPHYGEQP